MPSEYVLTVNEGEGLGLQFSIQDDHVYCCEPVLGSYCDKAGQRPGVLKEVNGIPITDADSMKAAIERTRSQGHPAVVRLLIDHDAPTGQLHQQGQTAQKQDAKASDKPEQQNQQQQLSSQRQSQKEVLEERLFHLPQPDLLIPMMPLFEPSHDPVAASFLREAQDKVQHDMPPHAFELPNKDILFWENMCIQAYLSPDAQQEPHLMVRASHTPDVLTVNRTWLSSFVLAWERAFPHAITVSNEVSTVPFNASDAFWRSAVEALQHCVSTELVVRSSGSPEILRPALAEWNLFVDRWVTQHKVTTDDLEYQLQQRRRQCEALYVGEGSTPERTSGDLDRRSSSHLQQRVEYQPSEHLQQSSQERSEPLQHTGPVYDRRSDIINPCSRCKTLDKRVQQLETSLASHNQREAMLTEREQNLIALEMGYPAQKTFTQSGVPKYSSLPSAAAAMLPGHGNRPTPPHPHPSRSLPYNVGTYLPHTPEMYAPPPVLAPPATPAPLALTAAPAPAARTPVRIRPTVSPTRSMRKFSHLQCYNDI
eukprot:TRINITY_DN8771_c0_g1_i2.p1 TRINITY_DN8771_c0_g1~~TRINITY_DN8771_c0_g1_i2.p1  ORF type:complete len:537 (+),score=71.00 TRINITY_DN8771_c0_g1_i2:600-2210(+)